MFGINGIRNLGLLITAAILVNITPSPVSAQSSPPATRNLTVRVTDDSGQALPMEGVQVCVGSNVWSSDSQGQIVFTGEEAIFGKASTNGNGDARFNMVSSYVYPGGRAARTVVISAVKPGVGLGANWVTFSSLPTTVNLTLNTGNNVIGPIPESCSTLGHAAMTVTQQDSCLSNLNNYNSCVSCNLCSDNSRGNLLCETRLSFIDAVTPKIGGPGSVITLRGGNLELLPEANAYLRFKGVQNRNGNCETTQVIDVPLTTEDFDEDDIDEHYPKAALITDPNDSTMTVIKAQLPREMTLRNDKKTFIGAYTITDITLTYKDDAPTCSQEEEIYGITHRSHQCDQPAPVFVYPPFSLRPTSVSNTQIDLSWDYDQVRVNYIDRYRIYMHWCQPAFEDCNSIDPYDYTINATKRNSSGTDVRFWEELKDPNGDPAYVSYTANGYSVRANPAGNPNNWSNSTLFLAVTALKGTDESDPTLVKVTIP